MVLAAGQVSNLELRPGLLLLFVSLEVPPLTFDCEDDDKYDDDDNCDDDEVVPPPDKHGLSSLP